MALWAFPGSSSGVYGVLYDNMPAIEVCVELLKAKSRC